ncbi:MAG: cytochrome c3 family protein [Deltaproteobacteria bacterium]|nr:cytochrome c3 family protein [Deltaproteobacteria bacterium]
MKNICVLFAFFVVIILYCMTSCTPVAGPVIEPPAAETAVEKPLFMGEKHNAANVECGGCHQEDPPAKGVATDVCIGCHEEYSPSNRSEATDLMDPHNSHMTYPDCDACHNAHKASREQCASCHGDLGFNIP